MKEIEYESLIAGLLLKFDSIDNIDFNLLVEDFQNKTKVKVWGLWYGLDSIDKYVQCKNDGSISLKEGITLDYYIENENIRLRNKLRRVAGSIVIDYINNLDIEKYKKEKEETIRDNKEKVLNESNVLLISDIQDDYDELIKYGFKNVDYFKSIIRADAYFEKHLDELKKYHIILKGYQKVQRCCFEGDVELDKKIFQLSDEDNILVTNLSRYDYPNHIELVTYLSDRDNFRYWDVNELTYKDFFDRIAENMLINHTLERVDLKGRKFIPIQDEINPNRLPLPTKKKDLKILYLEYLQVNEFAKRISEELGLNIDFKEDNNYSLSRYVKSHLGDYDIIIASDAYSDNLLRMNDESTEQCKDTGRELTLLVNYDDIHWWAVDKDFGEGIDLKYKFGGNIAPTKEYYSKKFRTLRSQIKTDEYKKEYNQSKYSFMKAIIESSVNFYNEALLQMGKNGISDLDFKTADEFDSEYELAIKEERKREEAELAPIELFDSMRFPVLKYLNYRKFGLIKKVPEELIITEGEYGVRVTNLYEGRPLCVITFSKRYKIEDLRIFQIQTLSKKGILSNPQTVGLYTSKYENLDDTSNRPNEAQENALLFTLNKINTVLRPLNEEALEKELAQNSKESETLNLKK